LSSIDELFDDQKLIEKIKRKLPLRTQKEVFEKIGRERYIKLPKSGTNPRGVEITKEALTELIENQYTKKITIHWIREKIEFNPYKKWIEMWSED